MGMRSPAMSAAILIGLAPAAFAQAPVTSDKPSASSLPPLSGPAIDVPIWPAPATALPPGQAPPQVQAPAQVQAPPPPPTEATGAPTPLAPPSDRPAAQIPLPPEQPAADTGGSSQPPMVVQQPPPSPAPVVRDQKAAPAIAEQPPAPPAPVRSDPPGATVSPLPCKDGTYAAMIDGRPQTVRARLCQQPDGSWKVSPP